MKKKLSVFLSLLLALSMILPTAAMPVAAEGEGDTPAESKYEQLESPAVTYNMNVDWKFKKATAHSSLTNAINSVKDSSDKLFYETDYDDSGWETVSVPHPINAIDSFDGNCYDSGEGGIFRGFMFYRKHVTVPASDAGKKFFLEFEAVRNSVYLYVNGEMVGYYEAGITASGYDITDYIHVGEDNVIAVATDNGDSRGQTDKDNITTETKPGTTPGSRSGYGYQWNTKDFNEVQGGITGNVNLYAKGKIYQTLPLYNNLKTSGNYIYGTNFDIDAKTAKINVKAEVRNETAADANLTLQVDVVGMDGKLAYTFEKAGTASKATDLATSHYMNMVPEDAYDYAETEKNDPDMSTIDVSYIEASYDASNMRFWSDKDPYLYTVYTYLKNGEDIIDAQKIVTGFRKVEYTIGGGLKINDKYTYLKGYAQRATNEWAVIGVANDWLTDIDMELLKESNGNHIRWMHVAPKPVAVRGSDKYGVIVTCPAGDKEGDTTGRAWDQRVEAMRDAVIYFKNSPSVLFWEAGNQAVTPAHMKTMVNIRKKFDPDGGRFMGSRTISSVDQIKEAEYVGTMENRNASAAKTSMASAGGKYMPIMDTEYARDEAPRRVWDDYSPPDYDYDNMYLGAGASKQDGYDIWDQTSEDFAVGNAKQYNQFWAGRVTGGGSELYVGGAIMVWSDSNMHTRNTASENCRTSGKVDPVRIKKEVFYALQAVQSDEPKIHIVGHWNYPKYTKGDKDNGNYWYEDKTYNGTYWEKNGTLLQRDPTKKTVYVIGSPDITKVELYVNDELVGTDLKPDENFVYAFNDIDVTKSGKVSAKAYNESEIMCAEDEIVTAGEPDHIELTPVTGPDGLIADGSDVMYYDLAVVDEDGNVCPLSYDRVDLTLNGEGVLLGGYNSGVGDKITTNKVENNVGYTYAECGVNRIFVRSTRTAGTFTLKAQMQGLADKEVSLTTVAYDNTVKDGENTVGTGLSTDLQNAYTPGEKPPVVEEKVEAFNVLGQPLKADFDETEGNTYIYEEPDTNIYYTITVNGTQVTTTAKPYIPGGGAQTNVIAEVKPVLDALKAAGAPITYVEQTEKPSYVTAGNLPVITITGGIREDAVTDMGSKVTQLDIANGYTTVIINAGDSQNLMDAEANTTKAGDLQAELKVMLGYLDGVSFTRDDENGVFKISYTNSKVAVTAQEDITDAKLIFAAYDSETNALKSVNTDTTVTLAAGETKEFSVPGGMEENGVIVKAMLWKSVTDMEPIYAPVTIEGGSVSMPESVAVQSVDTENYDISLMDDSTDYSLYEKVQYTENYNTNTQTDGPDGTGYFQATASDSDKIAYSGVGAYLASDSLFEMDFRFDAATGSMRMSNGNNKTGPLFTLSGTTLRTDTGSGTNDKQNLGTVEVGKWYKMEIEGKMGVGDAYADFRLYEYKDGVPVLTNTKEGMNLRNFANASNGHSDNIKVSGGVSIDNVKITSLYASDVAVTALKDDIKANESVQLTATATRKGKAVTIPTFEWTILDGEGHEITDDSVTVTSSGMLITTADAATQTVTVRATATTEGNPYGEKEISITAIDTSNDTFDAISLDSDQEYVRTGEDATITVTATKGGEAVTPANDDIVWSVYNEKNIREVKNSGIHVTNGVVSVEDYVIPQTITVRASNKSGSAVANVKLNIKPGTMILDGEMGNKDTFVAGDACEELVTGLDLQDGSWDGSGYYKLTSATNLAGFGGNTTEHVLYSADIRFDEVNAGWDVTNEGDGRVGMQGRRTDANKLKIESGSTYIDIDPEAWYNISIMCSTGNANAYAHMIIYKYKDGVKVHPVTEAVGEPYVAQNIYMRNLRADFSPLSPASHMKFQAGTSVDNVYVAKTTPDGIDVTVDKDTMFAGQTIQGTATATRQGVPYGYTSADLIKWVVYNSDNTAPLGSDLITVDSSGTLNVDALAGAQTVYLRAQTIDGLLHDEVKITINTSDIFNVKAIGFDEDYTKVQELKVVKNFSYSDDVTFVIAVYDSTETQLKSVTTKTMSAKNIAKSEDGVGVSIESILPAGFDKTSDVLYVYTVTSLSENEAVTEDDGQITASLIESGTKLGIETIPEFDASSPVIVLVLAPGATTTSVNDEDIVYVKQFTGTTVKELSEISMGASPAAGDYIIKIVGKQSGLSSIATGVVTQPPPPTTP